MAVFQHCSVLLEVKTLPFKEKTKLKSSVTDNGGRICYVVNKQCSLVVTSAVSELSSTRLRGIQKHQTPVVGLDYVHSCLERGLLLPVEDYRLDASSPAASCPPLPPPSLKHQVFKEAAAVPVHSVGPSQEAKGGAVREEFRVYSGTDSDLPTYPEDFQVAKYSIFKKMNSWCVLELQSCRAAAGRRYRVVQHWRDDASTKAAARDTLVFLSTSEEAVQVYEAQRESLQAAGLQIRTGTPTLDQHLGSAPLQQLLLEEKLHTGRLSQEVGVFVELLWTEALGRLTDVLRVPIDQLSLNDVSRVEGLLLEAQRKLREASPSEAASLLDEVYTLLPHAEPLQRAAAPTARLLSQKLDLCQLIRDVLNVSEATLRSSAPSSLGKYRALRCGIEAVAPDTPEFQTVAALLQNGPVQVRRVLRVGRGAELQTFRREVGNVKPLLHSSSPSNFVGVLSRGLLLPRVGVEHHGIERTDVGHLGSGIYFSDAVSASLKYSAPSRTDGSRLLLVCDVALGRCRDVRRRDATLTQAPEGHHSVHGVRRTASAHSEFEDDEYVVYAADQVKLKYVVQFSVDGERVKEFSPAVDTSEEAPPTSDRGQESTQEDDEVEVNKNPLADVKAGLMDAAGQQLPLQAVHVKCKLMDLLSQVIIFQKYSNQSSAPIEAKYVFPLDDSAAVCGFEAFINGKHVVGQVKEKEAARREYKQAIEKGHGAYLMDQDAPDVFTISVGNLPPGAAVLIKVTFVCELVVRDGSVLFSLPGSVAPWQESAALNQTTQVSVEKVCVTDEEREFSLDVSVEMPNKITALQCITHKVKTKRTDCKAVVSVLPGEVMGQDGFQLSITLSDVHLPRMWVEQHPDKDSQATMLVFYPDFQVDSASAPDEVVLLVDASESMKGEPLRAARTVARHVIRTLDHNLRLNVIFFGTDHADAFLTARPLAEARPAAESFIKRSPPVGGSTELWRPLRALSLLPPSRGVRNLLLLSDGHLQNAELALRLLRDNARHSRLFTCGFSPTANRHMLRALARAGGGAYEYFDTKTKHNWAEKAACQLKRMASPGCSSVSVKWQQFDPAAPPAVQAPRQLHALFNDCHALVYGFVPHCTQATLLGDLSGQELKTMVSTSELQKTKGTFLHKLTARAVIRDYEDGSLDSNEAEHECKKKELKRFVIELSKEFSILSQFTSFVAVEERDPDQTGEGFTDIPKLIFEEDVDFLPYISWTSPQDSEEGEPMEMDVDMEIAVPRTYSRCILDEDDIHDYVEEEEEEDEEEEDGGDEEYASPIFECAYSPDTVGSSTKRTNICRTRTGKQKDEEEDAALEECARVQESESYEFEELSFSPSCSPTSESSGLGWCSLMNASSAPLFLPPHLPLPYFQPPADTFHAPPPPPLPVSQGILHSSSLLCSPSTPHVPPPRRGGPPLSRDSLMSQRSLSHKSTWHPVDFTTISTLYDSAGVQSVNLMKKASSQWTPTGSTLRSQGLQKPQHHQPNLMLRSREFRKNSQADTGRAPATPAAQSSGFSFGGSQGQAQGQALLQAQLQAQLPARFEAHFQAHSAPRMYGVASETTQSDHQPAVDLSQDYMIKSRHRKLQSLLVPQDRQTEYKGACVTPAVPSPTFGVIGSRIQAHDLSDRLMTEETSNQSGPQVKRAVGRTNKRSVERFKEIFGRPSLSTVHQHAQEATAVPEALPLKWTKIFQMQQSEGYWELTTELGKLIDFNVDLFANEFLKNKGIQSLGVKAHRDILRLVATLLVLQLMRVKSLEEGKLLRTLFSLDDSSLHRPARWEELKRAVDWVCWADHQYPCVYSRLEFGLNWETCTRQLLGLQGLPPLSALTGLKLQKTSRVLVF
ncbi:protein mono-ADP-ribosyltransferase PARP4 [Clinocottus analis]|uniref:protein mono-ADP-ribosyltransferase PARP4 n=1 Tax=Clinocottus analis TaxID=304258 RepID=UPI0035BF6DC8